MLYDLEAVPKLVQKTLELNDSIEEISAIYKDVSNALYLGRGNCFPVALEGALKLKEISYINAEGYPAAEMKHGPIALIDENMPVVVIATKDNSYEKVVSNIQEVKARKGKVIAVLTEGDTTVSEFADHVIEIGPYGGEKGWKLVFSGTPCKLAKKATLTGTFLGKQLAKIEPKG